MRLTFTDMAGWRQLKLRTTSVDMKGFYFIFYIMSAEQSLYFSEAGLKTKETQEMQ